MIARKTLDAIAAQLEATQEREHRRHLGASIIGEACRRKQWYIFRWAAKELFSGRMLRLFNRGHLEENRFVGFLRSIGAKVWDQNPETGKQFRVSACRGHFGGALDGLGYGIPDLPPPEWFLPEFKTMNDKAFKLVEKDGVAIAQRKHFIQAQAYGNLIGVSYALYMAVNKNDDAIHSELIRIDPREGRGIVDKAEAIIFAPAAPERITNDPTRFDCRFCHFHSICHKGASPEKNCRTCGFSAPVDDGKWRCNRYGVELTTEDQKRDDCPGYVKHASFTK